MNDTSALPVPRWVPEGARRYLAHTEAGRSIRDLARGAGCHASTVLRQIRKVELRRDDPLVDAALQTLAQTHFPPIDARKGTARRGSSRDIAKMAAENTQKSDLLDTATLDAEAIRVLRRLCESGAVLAVAEDMDKAVVVRDDGQTGSTRTAVVDCTIAQALALKDWISCDNPGRISRYRITATGRAALGQLLAEAENRARSQKDNGFAEAQMPFSGARTDDEAANEPLGRPRRMRYNMTESPLVALARRKDRDGQPFLVEGLVRAGERLREDFELAQMGPNVAQNWDRFLTGGGRNGFAPESDAGHGSMDARNRVSRALSDLGPGLSDVVLRCCCYLEGLETAEKQLGWSARSGKIVLRIALQRLKRHYDELSSSDQMIG
ncbi:DUF6456 domain-containing protein [Falsiruegeria mediterranea]|jgi:Domain of unknown function (DUF6456)|uniref:DUF6456 domain-containing protein n=1 Tax=Falsiruegeria mediterranea M17 TaxID=1200281 RepID=A0A2R8CBP2_9RHOB|nr:DUF6456 domain-containing protein [Falsiruegeria mediterranea]SPJ29795.1 hypothetical protein TRM7615_03317 [Falsiruegeria mediterranea M17]